MRPERPELLAIRLSGRENSLNAVRLVLASLVILGHSWPLVGSEEEPNLEFLSGIAVNGFFAVSGYLIAASRFGTSLLPYLWRRALRIFPAFFTCLVATAVIFGPLAAALTETTYPWEAAFGYVVGNALLHIQQWGIGSTLQGLPYPDVWNGSLWTLGYEFLAYLVLGALLTVPGVRRHARIVLPLLFFGAVAAWLLIEGPIEVTTNFYHRAARLSSYFLAGAAAFALSQRIPVRRWMVVAAAAAYVALWSLGVDFHLGQIPLAYVLLCAGSIQTTNFTTRHDVSYGVYIYAFPIQQVLVLLGTASLGVLANTLMTLAITLGVAWLSWRFIEKPCLALKDVGPWAGRGSRVTARADVDTARRP